ncbi:MAG: aldo/keto reductase, partial [SAR202 cluster bacterium]|nr:aldo/keto reductase [SAR202 cluster bacterium]
ETVAKTAGRSMLDLSIGWLATQSHVVSVIAGATSAKQVRANADAGAWILDAAQLAQGDVITPPPTSPNRPLRRRST